MLKPTIDAMLIDAIQESARLVRSEVLACGVAADHVHAVVRVSATDRIADVAQRMKGRTARLWNRDHPSRIEWQNGYWARSVEAENLGGLLDYVGNQRERHAMGDVDPSLEQHLATVADDSERVD